MKNLKSLTLWLVLILLFCFCTKEETAEHKGLWPTEGWTESYAYKDEGGGGMMG